MAAVLTEYASWLAEQPLSERTREAYLAAVTAFLAWLEQRDAGPGDAGAARTGSRRRWHRPTVRRTARSAASSATARCNATRVLANVALTLVYETAREEHRYEMSR